MAHIFGGDKFSNTRDIEVGIYQTALGTVFFVLGVGLSQIFPNKQRDIKTPQRHKKRLNFPVFCLIASLLSFFLLRFLSNIPTIGAIATNGSLIWVLGVLLGLRSALRRRLPKAIGFWLIAMSVYPAIMLLQAGFLSFGSTPVFVILASLVISTRSNWRVGVALPIVAITFISAFISYFNNRDNIREAVWWGGTFERRIEEASKIVSDFELFDSENDRHLSALDQRLNQNMFAGMAANQIADGKVSLLYGKSIWEGFLQMIPRVIWPGKPVYGGSPEIIREMTGYEMNDSTSFGVGNVMEFYINFGTSSLVIGFLLLGLLFGWLDKKSALAEREGDLSKCIIYFIPAVAMIHPNGSVVELVGNGICAYITALGWVLLWDYLTTEGRGKNKRPKISGPAAGLRRTGRSNKVVSPPAVD